jgi:predicted methyltransferase
VVTGPRPAKLRLLIGVGGAILALLAATGARAATAPATDSATLQLIDKALASELRSAKNRARDVYRHPRQTLQFFGLRADMTVVEIWPEQGWYTEILAPVLKARGHYIAALNTPAGVAVEEAKGTASFEQKFKDSPEVMGPLKVTGFSASALDLAAPNSVDMVVTFRNIHNWLADEWADKAFAAMFKALKPGGILGVVEHRGNPATPQDPHAKSGYVNEDYAIKLIEGAGFALLAKSEINANSKDIKQYPKGVWTLPPVLRMGEQDRDKYLAIGESDRFTLRFQKPK